MRPPRIEDGYSRPTVQPNRFFDTTVAMARPGLEAARANLEASRQGVGAYLANMPMALMNLGQAGVGGFAGLVADLVPGDDFATERDLAREVLAVPEAFMGVSPGRVANVLDDAVESGAEAARFAGARLNQPGPMPETLFSGVGPTFSDRDLEQVVRHLLPPLSPVTGARVDGTGLTSPAFQRALEITQPTAPASQYLRTLIGNNPRIEQELRWSGAYQQLEALGDEVIPLGDLQSYVGSRADLFSVETLRGEGRTGGMFRDAFNAVVAQDRVAPRLEAEISQGIADRFPLLSEALANRTMRDLQEDGIYVSSGARENPEEYRFDRLFNEIVVDQPSYLRDSYISEAYGESYPELLRRRTAEEMLTLSPAEIESVLEESIRRRTDGDDLQFFGSSGDTRFSSYVLPGARDYRENIVRINPQVAEVRGSNNPLIDQMARRHFDRGEVPVYHTRTVTLPFRNNRPGRDDLAPDGNAHFIAEAQADAQQGIRNDKTLGVYDVTGSPEVVRDRYRALESEGKAILDNVEPIVMQWHQLGREAFDLRRSSIGLDAYPPEVQRRLNEIGEERLQLNRQAEREAMSAAGPNSPLRDILERTLRGSFNERILRPADGPTQYFMPNYGIDEGRFDDIVSSVFPEDIEMGLPLSNSSSEWLDHALRRELRVAIDEGRDALILTPGVLPQRYSDAGTGVAEFYDKIGRIRMTNLLRQIYGKSDAPKLDTVWVQTQRDGWLEAPVIRINDELIERVEEKGLRNFRDGGEVRRGIGALNEVARGMYRGPRPADRGGIGALSDVARGMFRA
jgi:hypothetical protein